MDSTLVNVDSAYLQLENKVDSINVVIKNHEYAESFFSDILNHQWTLLSIQTAIFIAIILIIITLIGFISWKLYYIKLSSKLKELEESNLYLAKKIESYETIEKGIVKASQLALRSLYEQKGQNIKWKIIWHIRYCEWFYDNNQLKGLKVRLKKLEKEILEAETKPRIFNSLKNFENKKGLMDILQKILGSDDKDILDIVIRIIKKIE